MIVAGSASPLLLSSAGGYNLTNSLRFRSSASAYLSRTLTTPTNSQKFTFSDWVKRGSLASNQFILQAGNSVNDEAQWYFTTSDTIRFYQYTGSYQYDFTTAQVFRDPSAWYHIVVQYDSTESTTANRFRVYVNGSQITLTASTNVTLNATNSKVNSAVSHDIGGSNIESRWFDGYMTEINFIDGQALTPSSFGETSSTTGVWIPKKYSGTYGTNGFYLPFTDNSALTTSSNVGLGKDFSGNSNYWTTNNISITSGSTYDSMTDVPTLTSATTANYAVINPLQNGGLTITNGNLTWAGAGSSAKCATGSIAMPSGKWYFEALITGSSGGNLYAGVCNLSPTLTSAPVSTSTGWGLMTGGGGTVLYKANNNNFTILSNTGVTGSVVSFAIDVDAGKIWFAQNGTYLEGSPSAGTGASFTNLTGTQIPFVAGYDSNDQGSINFGQRPFSYTPPTGFVRLNTFNLPTPTIGATASTQAGKYFNPVLYTGTGSSPLSISGVNFQPDFVWIKDRTGANNHCLFDAVRGVQLLVNSNTTSSEQNFSNSLTSFNSNGFTLGDYGNVNLNSSSNYVSWNWKANGAGSSNTAGSITSTVSANTSAGFSIATFTSPSSGTASFGHGLGVTPSFVIVKSRASGNWICQHTSTGTQYLLLNGTGAAVTDSTVWNSAPTSSVVNIGTGFAGTINYVAYCFAQVAGYSAFGLYTGNGVSDGPFIYTGFRPRFVMIKASGTTGAWSMTDTSRDPYNLTTNKLEANTALSEPSNAGLYQFDILSNGFKIRQGTGYGINNSADYIYMAFAENPFKYANAR